ncbi:serine/threonine protein kinase [Streptomyces olivaceus]|uniref:serine/threonine-protein kinase n=1 Tax=Streptomyces olivaceus TaxID=47716 RepID=UPI001CCF519B|nr:serine/threonine-protein kinase [Streptomyces olivaceus]MBZ6197977.1 serine/threonine protein kinase [Streptomyces olivaceus]MBZ6203447.1 serine/threonine protein kinase [Streptomyces olivaceus]
MPAGGTPKRPVDRHALEQHRLIAGRYRLRELLGSGGMGAVWRAEDEFLGRDVALKRIHVQPHLSDDERERLHERTRREARSAARITHPSVIVVHDVVDDTPGGDEPAGAAGPALPCIVMEYVRSRTLAEVLDERGTLPPAEAARIGHRMVTALSAAHAAGVLHRDVKPGNVLLGADGRVVLTDFGIAVSTGTSTLTRTGEIVGSVGYLAPERVRGRTPGPASDLWSLGATLFEAVEGYSPFRRDTAMETVYAIGVDPLPALTARGPLADLIAELLRKEPESRPGAAETGQRLEAAAVSTATADTARLPAPGIHTADLPVPSGTVPAGDGASGTPARRRAVRAGLAVLAAAAVAGGGVAYLAGQDGESRNAAPDTAATGPSPSPEASDGKVPSATPSGPRYATAEPLGPGLAMPVPEGWRRDSAGADVLYVDPTGTVRLQIGATEFEDVGPKANLEQDEESSRAGGKLPDYERLRLDGAEYRGQDAAVWEFTFAGETRRFRAINFGFDTADGRHFALYLSAPADRWGDYVGVYETVRDGIDTGDGESA